jgi:hypothetical protein
MSRHVQAVTTTCPAKTNSSPLGLRSTLDHSLRSFAYESPLSRWTAAMKPSGFSRLTITEFALRFLKPVLSARPRYSGGPITSSTRPESVEDRAPGGRIRLTGLRHTLARRGLDLLVRHRAPSMALSRRLATATGDHDGRQRRFHARAAPLLSSGATTSAGLAWLGSGRHDCQQQNTLAGPGCNPRAGVQPTGRGATQWMLSIGP